MTSPITPRGFYSYFDCFWRMAEFLAERGIDDPLVKRGPARIYSMLEHHFDVLHDGHDLRAWMQNETERRIYDFYLEEKSSWINNTLLSEELIGKIRKAERVYVYGAGELGERVVKILTARDIAIDGVFVTNAADNQKSLFGHRVYQFDTARACALGSLVVVSVTDGLRAEIENLLDQGGWSHVYCKD